MLSFKYPLYAFLMVLKPVLKRTGHIVTTKDENFLTMEYGDTTSVKNHLEHQKQNNVPMLSQLSFYDKMIAADWADVITATISHVQQGFHSYSVANSTNNLFAISKPCLNEEEIENNNILQILQELDKKCNTPKDAVLSVIRQMVGKVQHLFNEPKTFSCCHIQHNNDKNAVLNVLYNFIDTETFEFAPAVDITVTKKRLIGSNQLNFKFTSTSPIFQHLNGLDINCIV